MIKSIFAFPFTGIHQSMTGCTQQIEEICQAQCENDCPIYLQYDLSICEDRCLGRCFSKMCKTDEADPFADYTTDTNNQLFGLLF